MAIVGVKISGVTDASIENDAVVFIQANLIMRPEDIRKALKIPDFIFYSPLFKIATLTGHSFTVASVSFPDGSLAYVNVSGGAIEIPIYQDSTKTLYQRLKADDYYPKAGIASNDVLKMLDAFVGQGQLMIMDGLGGDFDPMDFDPDDFLM
jgi:hypothetical protein